MSIYIPRIIQIYFTDVNRTVKFSWNSILTLIYSLTVKEAAAYSNIGMNLIDKLLRTPNCPCVLFVGKKKLVKRKEFEEYISKTLIF